MSFLFGGGARKSPDPLTAICLDSSPDLELTRARPELCGSGQDRDGRSRIRHDHRRLASFPSLHLLLCADLPPNIFYPLTSPLPLDLIMFPTLLGTTAYVHWEYPTQQPPRHILPHEMHSTQPELASVCRGRLAQG